MARILTAITLILLALCLDAAPAFALIRTYVSSHGSNAAGCGTPASPCQTLQYAHAFTSSGGEIVILDSGLYGPVTITKAISIVNDGVGTATVYAGANGNAITIATANATDVVHLRGLEIDGLGVAANGILFKGQGSVDVVRCVVRRFTGSNADGSGHGVIIRQGGSAPITFTITDTTVSDNRGVGVYVAQQVAAVAQVHGNISRTTMNRNALGFDINAFSTTSTWVDVTIVDSVATNNGTGLFLLGASSNFSAQLKLRNVTVSDNTNEGIHVDSGGSVKIAHSLVQNSCIGSCGIVCANGGQVGSFGDNNITAASSCLPFSIYTQN